MAYRILVVNWQDLSHPMSGGAEVHLESNLRLWASAGHDVTLLCCGYESGAAEEIIEGVRVIRDGSRSTFNWTVPRRIKRLLAANRYDLLIEDINKIPVYTPRFCRIPILVVVPHLFATTVFHEINFVMASYIYLMERPVVRSYRNAPWVVISQSTKDDLVARGLPADQIRVIHCGIDHDLYCAAPDVARFERPTVTYLGRLKKYKSVDKMIAAMGLLRGDIPDLQAYVVGAGDDRPRLERQVRRLGLDDVVTFTGFVDAARKVELLRRSWAVVCPSLKEGWGLTNIESNACGTPVICADVPGLRDSAVDGTTGLLYPHGEVGALADRIRRLVSDSKLRETLCTGALAWADRFHWDESAREAEAVIDRVVRGDIRVGLG